MSIKGNVVGMTMPRTNYEQTDKTKPDYLRGKDTLDKSIQDLKDRLDSMASAKKDEDGNTNIINVAAPIQPTDGANKEYVDKNRGVKMFVGDAQPEGTNILWFNTAASSAVSTSGVMMLDLGDEGEASEVSLAVEDDSYPVINVSSSGQTEQTYDYTII